MIVFVWFFLAIYCLFLLILLVCWRRMLRKKREPLESGKTPLRITVIIPVRNEEKTIPIILQDLLLQSYPSFEIMVVDDHSSDSTTQQVRAFANHRLKLITNKGVGKKDALRTAIEQCDSDLILTTDADCRMSIDWISAMASSFHNPKVMMATGPVKLSEGSLFTKIQQIEFASLVGASVVAIEVNRPLTCNGANLCYRRSVFFEVGGFEDNIQTPSGDDEFLMHKISTRYPNGIVAVKDTAAVVSTLAQPNVKAFLSQRLRWASKWRLNRSFPARISAVFVLLVQLAWLFAIIGCFMGKQDLFPLVITKVVLECVILINFCRFLNIRWNWLAFIILQFLYPVYVIIVGVFSQLTTFSWKGRLYR